MCVVYIFALGLVVVFI